MTDNVNSTMFTNGRAPSGPSDLLQQALQGVEDEEDQQNFVGYIESDENGSQTLRLSPEMAAQFGFNVNAEGEISGEVTFLQNDEGVVSEVQSEINANNIPEINSTSYNEWTTQDTNEAVTFQQDMMESSISMDNIDLSNTENNTQDSSTLLEHSNDLMKDSVLQQDKISPFDKSQSNTPDNCLQYTLLDNQSTQPQSFVTVTNSQGQIIQGLPIMLSSSQYSLKPIQPQVMPTKNVRILPSTSKITTSVSNVHSINNGTNSNTVLFPNGTLLNTVSPQVIKTMPISPQFLNSNSIVNASDFSSGTCKISNQSGISDSIPSISTTISSNLINNQFPQLLKMNQSSVQAGNIQQILTSVMKSTNSTSTTLQNTPVFTTSNIKAPMINSYRKTVQISNPVGRPCISHVKTAMTKHFPKMASTVVLQNSGQVKFQEIKNTINSTSVLRNTSPISVLKPQPKPSIGKRVVNLQSLSNISNNVQNLQKSAGLKQSSIVERLIDKNSIPCNGNQNRTVKSLKNIKPMPGMILEKLKNSNLYTIKPATSCMSTNSSSIPTISRPATNTTSSIVSKCTYSTSKSNTILTAPRSTYTDSTISKSNELFSRSDLLKHDNTKPLGTCKNPIPIITHSQGNTFVINDNVPSSQISHIFQKGHRENNSDQYSRQNVMKNGKVFLQIVYPTDMDLVDRHTTTVEKRPAKRGRPKKNTVRPQVFPVKPVLEEEKEVKHDRKKIIARTRSGRLSRPPKHMVRDYKHLHPIDFTQPDLDDSDGGYSDYNTNGEGLEDDESPKELLTGLEVPKRKVSKEYICPTCTKTYLGREKMIIHFEKNPSHGSIDQLPPPKPKLEFNQVSLDTLKRKGKKRGPWGTPEEKSARRQEKLQNAIAVCEKTEICNIAAKPVLESMSIYDLMVLKSENNVMNFMGELKDLIDKVRIKSRTFLTTARDEERNDTDIMNLNDDLICDALGLNPGLYKINNNAFIKEELFGDDEPPTKKLKTDSGEEEQNNVEERTSSGFSEGSDASLSSNCADVPSVANLLPKDSNPNDEPCKLLGSKLVISNPEIQNELCENNGFRKIDISTSNSNFLKYETPIVSNTDQQAFIKLDSTEKRFVKLDTGMMDSFQNQNSENFRDIQEFETTSESFNKDFQTSRESGSEIFEGLHDLTHLEMLNGTEGIEQSRMTEQIDQIVNEKLSEMLPGDLLENNSMATDISFGFNSSLNEDYTFRSIRS